MKCLIVLCLVIIRCHLGKTELEDVTNVIWDFVEELFEGELPLRGKGKGYTTTSTLLKVVCLPNRIKLIKWLKNNPDEDPNKPKHQVTKERYFNLMLYLKDVEDLDALRYNLVNEKIARPKQTTEGKDPFVELP